MAREKAKEKRGFFGILIRIIMWILGVFLLLFLLIFGGWNIGKKFYFGDYYKVKEDLQVNPGLNDGYVPQGMSYIPSKKTYLTSGYMSDHSASRLYTVTEEGNIHYTKVFFDDGTACTYHFGGVAVSGDYVYIAGSSKINVVSLEEVLTKDEVQILQQIEVNNKASFTYIRDNSLYVGEFYDGEKYKTDHKFKDEENAVEYNAIVTRYEFVVVAGYTQMIPVYAYAVRDQVQGFCVTDKGNLVMSTSYGLKPSHFYVYKEPQKILPDALIDGLPVYFVGEKNLINDLKAPSMAEDLDFYQGKVIYCSESACNKYIFGKFFFYDKIYALTLD